MNTKPLQTLEEKIRQRRSQMLTHSYLYYHLNTNIVSDDKWQQWSDELTEFQKEFDKPLHFYDNEFKDWDGSTGCHLPADGWVRDKAVTLLVQHEKLLA